MINKPTRGPMGLRLVQPLEFPHKLGVCERILGSQLSRLGIAWVETAAGIPWKLDLRNATHRWIVYGKYEGAPFLDWARAYLPPDGVVVDSGANIGQMLLYLAQWVPRGCVLAIEPGKHQADWLTECLAANPQLPVELIRLGLGAQRDSAFLNNPGNDDRHGSWNRVSTTSGEKIDMVPLVELLDERGMNHVDLWKLDVEGYEVAALQGAEDFLRDHRIRAIYSELDGDKGRAVVQHLAARGYELHTFSRRGEAKRVRAVSSEHTYGLFLPVVPKAGAR
jgi:FkbM family methyltransferase